MKNFSSILRVSLAALCLLAAGAAQADRVKDLATLAAQRPNQLIGYGLVVGLQGTGDDASVPFTTQSMKAMLSQMGVRIDGPLTDFETAATAARVDIKNTAAVLVTADLPGFAKPGQRIDINVSAIGKASNLRGGSLIMTAMRGVDGEIYALAQGALTATGIDASAAGSKVQIGVPTSARIPGGAIVERIVDTPFESAENVIYNIRENDFSTTTAIVNAINKKFGGDVAQAIDGTSVSVRAPQNLNQRVAFMSMVESLEVSAQLTSVAEVDVTNIVTLRERNKKSFESREGVKLSFMPFFAKAIVDTLKAHPVLNASMDMEAGTVTYHDAEHLAIAVDTDKGLLVPVIRNAGDLSIAGLARHINDLAERTRTGQVAPDELSGGTFTLTNTGSRGALFDTPIINQPQVAILGLGAIVKRPVVVTDADGRDSIAVRHMVYLSLTYDHRIVDGADAARYLVALKSRLETAHFDI